MANTESNSGNIDNIPEGGAELERKADQEPTERSGEHSQNASKEKGENDQPSSGDHNEPGNQSDIAPAPINEAKEPEPVRGSEQNDDEKL